jgi:hypothetical protein|nr:MAG TPA: protein of unknown function (DUF883) [Caudoviricetes sp.]
MFVTLSDGTVVEAEPVETESSETPETSDSKARFRDRVKQFVTDHPIITGAAISTVVGVVVMALTPTANKEDEEESKDLSEEEVEAIEASIADHIVTNE